MFQGLSDTDLLAAVEATEASEELRAAPPAVRTAAPEELSQEAAKDEAFESAALAMMDAMDAASDASMKRSFRSALVAHDKAVPREAALAVDRAQSPRVFAASAFREALVNPDLSADFDARDCLTFAPPPVRPAAGELPRPPAAAAPPLAPTPDVGAWPGWARPSAHSSTTSAAPILTCSRPPRAAARRGRPLLRSARTRSPRCGARTRATEPRRRNPGPTTTTRGPRTRRSATSTSGSRPGASPSARPRAARTSNI